MVVLDRRISYVRPCSLSDRNVGPDLSPLVGAKALLINNMTH
jgi:hypothetical protein